MLDRFERYLETVPQSKERPGFWSVTIRAVEPSETPVLEHEFRGPADAAAVVALAREHQNADCSYEAEAYWDLWHQWPSDGVWRRGPQRILLTCHGETYDANAAAESGHYRADLGFEHLFTGHARLLGSRGGQEEASNQMEAEFLARMRNEQNLREYHDKTRQNIRQLFNWIRTVEQAIPVAKTLLWSEGEDNLEARLDEILAVH